MLRLYNPRTIGTGAVTVPLAVDDDRWCIKHKWDGLDELSFEIPRKEDHVKEIVTEAIIQTEQNDFVIKNVDAHGSVIVVDAQINVDDWKAPFWHSYRKTETTIQEALTEIKPTGWTVQMIGTYTNRKTIDNGSGEGLEDVTAFDIVGRICTLWDCVVNYDTHSKTIKVINPATMGSSDVVLSEETNLKAQPDYVDNSGEFVTRLYPYGAKDETTGLNLTIESVNNGVPYLENGQYFVNKIISIGWTDERYTDAQSLITAAEHKLSELSNPTISMSFSLSEVDDDIKLYQTVKVMETGDVKQVVEYIEYPYCHHMDSITLSALTPSISYDVYEKKGSTQQAIDSVSERVTAIEEQPPWTASDTDLGAVIVGDGLDVSSDGTVSINVGQGLEIGQDGSLNVTGGGGSWDGRIGGANNQYGTIEQYNASDELMSVRNNFSDTGYDKYKRNLMTKDTNSQRTQNILWIQELSSADSGSTGKHNVKYGDTYKPNGVSGTKVAYNNGGAASSPNLGYNPILMGGAKLNIRVYPEVSDYTVANSAALDTGDTQILRYGYGDNADGQTVIRAQARAYRNASGNNTVGKGRSVVDTYLGGDDTYPVGGQKGDRNIVHIRSEKGYDASDNPVNKQSVDIGNDTCKSRVHGVFYARDSLYLRDASDDGIYLISIVNGQLTATLVDYEGGSGDPTQ